MCRCAHSSHGTVEAAMVSTNQLAERYRPCALPCDAPRSLWHRSSPKGECTSLSIAVRVGPRTQAAMDPHAVHRKEARMSTENFARAACAPLDAERSGSRQGFAHQGARRGDRTQTERERASDARPLRRSRRDERRTLGSGVHVRIGRERAGRALATGWCAVCMVGTHRCDLV